VSERVELVRKEEVSMSRAKAAVFAALFLFVLSAAVPATAQEKAIPDFSMMPRSEVPVQYTWRLEDIYATDEDWQKDKTALEGLVAQIDAKTAGWTESAEKMLGLLELSDAIYLKGERLFQYVGFKSDVDMGESKYQIMRGEMQSIFVQVGVKLAFVEDDLLKMNEETLRGYFVEEPRLEPYRFGIEQTLRRRVHILPTDQKEIVSMTGLFANAPAQASRFLNDVDLPTPDVTLADGTKITLNMANYLLYRGSANAMDRTLVMKTYWTNHKRFEHTFAALLDGDMKQDLFTAKTEKYKDCLQTRLDDDNIDTTVYFQLIDAVRSNLGTLRRFLALKKQLLGLDTLRYEDVYASAVKSIDKTYTFDESRAIVMNALKPLGPEYAAILTEAFNNRWIDIYPNKDKGSGAYSGGVYGVHSYVKMNYNGKYDNLSTLAHELGHAVHSYLANKNQPHANAGYPLFLAEIASTFNETMLLRHMLKSEKDDLVKLFLLDSYLDQVRGTIYRQTLFAEFELGMHRRIEAGKTLTPDWLSKSYLDLTRDYYGQDEGAMTVGDYIQNEWSGIPHFYRFYYVYQYATGMIASMALVDQVLGSKDGVERYLNMLKAGGSDYPLDLLKTAGVDMTTPAPAQAAFKRIDELVTEMEKIVARLKAQKKI
jgi:oligoendopeptidase F